MHLQTVLFLTSDFFNFWCLKYINKLVIMNNNVPFLPSSMSAMSVCCYWQPSLVPTAQQCSNYGFDIIV